jgi:hypothetical protein
VETSPPGFAARVLARHRASSPPGWDQLWLRFSLPALTASAVLLLIGTVLYWQSLGPGDGGLRPPLENAIIEQIRLL